MFNTPWHTNTFVTITNAFGTTKLGGISNVGTVFEIGLTGGVTNIYAFKGPDGAYPCSQLAISGGTFWGAPNALYGTTLGGGSSGYGTVFKVNPDGSGFADLYEFAGTNDGKFPQTGLLIDGNSLYGTTSNSIFKINTASGEFTCLTNVSNASQLILSLSGNTLYGTTTNGGTSNLGSLFSINTDGTGFKTIWSFTGATNNGAFPMGNLEILECSNAFWNGSTTDALFGMTYSGGMSNLGMVFSVETDGSHFTDLHDFIGKADGANPMGGLLLTNNNTLWENLRQFTYLYGTTSRGGASNSGTVFGIGLDGTGFTNLYNFGGTNGAKPEGKLVLVGQTLYGTTTTNSGAYTNGTIFSINTDSTDFSNLVEFSGGTNGASPVAGLALPVVDNPWSIWSLDTTVYLSAGMTNSYEIAIDDSYALFVNGVLVNEITNDGNAYWVSYPSSLPNLHLGENDVRVIIGGNGDCNDYFTMAVRGFLALPYVLYGTTYYGGSNGYGTVFEMGYSNDEIILHSFADTPDGKYPVGDLLLFSNTLYGATEQGGTNGSTEGTVFSISTAGTNYQILHSFTNNTDDGYDPMAGLILSSNMLYGTTYYGGSNNNSQGTIFCISTSGSNYSVLHSFHDSSGSDGYYPQAPLLLIGGTNLYGTTYGGGSNNEGTMFSICTNGSAYINFFSFGYSAGNNPAAGLILSGTNLYGTTKGGGNNSSGANVGTIFSFPLGGKTDVVLHAFSDVPDGNGPVAGLVLSGDTLYGTTEYGGSNSDGTTGDGTIFSIATSGNGYATLLSFGSTNSNFGVNPVSDLIVLSNSLYGTTYKGGINNFNYGMVFDLSTNGNGFSDLYEFMGSPDGANPQGGVCSP